MSAQPRRLQRLKVTRHTANWFDNPMHVVKERMLPIESAFQMNFFAMVCIVVLLLATPIQMPAQTTADALQPSPTSESKGAETAALVQQLQSGRLMHRPRVATVIALGKLGAAAAPAIPTLEQELTNGFAGSAYEAYRSLGAIRNEPPLDKQTLLERGADAFSGRDGFRAFQTVSDGMLPRDHALALLRSFLIKNPPVPEHMMALETLGSFEPSDPESVRVILMSLASTNDWVATNATKALARAAMIDRRSMDALAGGLLGRNERVTIESARALARFGSNAVPFMPSIVETLRRSRGQISYRRIGAYLHVLRAMGPDAQVATLHLANLLEEDASIYRGMAPFDARAVRRYLLLTLADIGTAPEAIPIIIDELTNALDQPSIAAAARAASSLPRGHEKVVPFLNQALGRKGLDMSVSMETIESLQRAPQRKSSAYLELIHALECMGPPAKVAVPVLRQRSRDPIKHSPLSPLYQKAAAQAADKLSL